MLIGDYEELIVQKVEQKPMGIDELTRELGDFEKDGDIINSLYDLIDSKKIRIIRHEGKFCYVAY